MVVPMKTVLWRLVAATAIAALPPVGRATAAAEVDAKVDAVFAEWTATTPGCAVGVAANGRPVLTKGYGMADLEREVRIAPDSIFEAGSVSKQFTAAAVLLLAREGKLSIDDPVRKYVPELPEYAAPPGATAAAYGEASPKPQTAKAGAQALLIRHMLNHTSGLRDWGSVAGIAGWPRTSRVHTHAHVLDIVARQRALNFTPGTNWSYSNTGFNLAAIIVSRVSGMPFVDFTRDRIFKPLGMTHTSWRDDYTHIVKGRAIAYERRGGELHTDMPFENVYGNGGLLTTVGDLLKWNENFAVPVVGDAVFVDEQQRPGRFNDGRPHLYAFGLYARSYKGVREMSHSGSTAGYRAFLSRYPDQRVSVAVLCNSAGADATELAHRVADIYLGDRLKPAPAPQVTAAQFAAAAGLYRSTMTGETLRIGSERRILGSRTWTFDAHGATATDEHGIVETYDRVTPATPTLDDLQAYAGTYESDEAETAMTAAVEDGKLVLKRRPDVTLALTPSYVDAFTGPQVNTVIFRRDDAGRVIALSVVLDRVWDMRFTRRTR
jgi:CubicO group peptidase (beta-lactamase class C family)